MLAETTRTETHPVAAAAESALRAVERATETPSRSAQAYAAQMAALFLAARSAKSPALARAIANARSLKQQAEALSVFHHEADHAWIKGDDDDALEAFEEAEAKWLAAWDRQKEAAVAVAEAPVSNLSDVMIRAQAYADVMGASENDLPQSDEDVVVYASSLRDGIREIMARDPAAEAFEHLARRHAGNTFNLDQAFEEEDQVDAGAVVLEPDAAADLHERIARREQERDAIENEILAADPPNLSALMLQFEVVCDRAALVDVGSYKARDRFCDAEINVDVLENNDDGLSLGLCLIATNLAALRDRDLPSDWRELKQSIEWLHSNGSDAARRAFDAGMHTADLKDIQIAHAPDDRLPTLTFQTSEGHVTFSPKAGFMIGGVA